MPTQTLPTRTEAPAAEKTSQGFAVALLLHLAVFAGLGVAAWVGHRTGRHWGDRDPTAGSIQASVVDALPLPPRQRYKDNEVLASDKPSVAPTPPAPAPVEPKAAPAPPKAEVPPKPNEVLIPAKVTPPKTAAKAPDKPAATPAAARTPVPPTPAPPSNTRVPVPPTPKATTGETAGIQIPQSITQLKNGTATVTIEERSFGDRYAYYVKLVSQKINASKQEDRDPPETKGKRTVIRFTINAEGNPVDPEVAVRSGSGTLDTATLRAIQRIDTFGPLPSGDHITIAFGYTSQ